MFDAMGHSGLVQQLVPGELRAADELSLWGVVGAMDPMGDLAEKPAPVGETAGQRRQRELKIASVGVAMDRLESNVGVQQRKRQKERAQSPQDEEGEDGGEADEEDL